MGYTVLSYLTFCGHVAVARRVRQGVRGGQAGELLRHHPLLRYLQAGGGQDTQDTCRLGRRDCQTRSDGAYGLYLIRASGRCEIF